MELFTTDSLLTQFEMKIEERAPGRLVISMPVTHKVRQPFGYLHGGASVALSETVASMGTADLIDLDKELGLGLEINANHISSVRSGRVKAVGEILHQGKTTHVWDIKVYDDNDRLLSVARCTVAVKTLR
ncbi:hotdog fold thioesterase [Macrococcus equipercicus]|uniref:PaaI family thioesterase n=2 Tax=Macrococcus equipercicus TaxID=69967 RepID=A0A9Q9BSC3_9STAP|nr:PaaI family thioesterase [Macrococcus equipercicus]UTH14839.1 PaaI family thioesterase [Macrococcus equipercicus]